MKSTITIAILAFFMLTACKKDYSCSCTETEITDGDTYVYNYNYSVKDASKKQAQSACNEAKLTQVDGADSYSVICELSK